jgi:hypothetical protein
MNSSDEVFDFVKALVDMCRIGPGIVTSSMPTQPKSKYHTAKEHLLSCLPWSLRQRGTQGPVTGSRVAPARRRKSSLDCCPDDDLADSNSVQLFRLCTIDNRFDPDYDPEESAGYRDVSINIEVGWKMQEGVVVFLPVHEWGDYHRHICEVQVSFQNPQILESGHLLVTPCTYL